MKDQDYLDQQLRALGISRAEFHRRIIDYVTERTRQRLTEPAMIERFMQATTEDEVAALWREAAEAARDEAMQLSPQELLERLEAGGEH